MARSDASSGYHRLLLDGERPVFAVHRHWLVLTTPALVVVGLLAASLFVLANASRPGVYSLAMLLMLATLGAVIYLVWQAIEREHEWFVLTDKRLVLTRGLLTKQTGTMPLAKVTDLSYEQPIIGELFGYGTFILESAGQDQALRQIDWVPHPIGHYRLVNAVTHGLRPDRRDTHLVLPGRPWWGPETPGASEEPDEGVAHHGEDRSRAIPLHGADEGRTIYESTDVTARRRSADTGPIRWFDPPS